MNKVADRLLNKSFKDTNYGVFNLCGFPIILSEGGYGWLLNVHINAPGYEDWLSCSQIPPFTTLNLTLDKNLKVRNVVFETTFHTKKVKNEYDELVYAEMLYNEAFVYSDRFIRNYQKKVNLLEINNRYYGFNGSSETCSLNKDGSIEEPLYKAFNRFTNEIVEIGTYDCLCTKYEENDNIEVYPLESK